MPEKEILDKELRARDAVLRGGIPSFIYMYQYTQEQVERKFKKPPLKIAWGCNSVFVKLNKTTGIKLFPTKDDAIKARRFQLRAYKKGLGPNTGKVVGINPKLITNKKLKNCLQDRLDLYSRSKRKMWGYVTEAVNVGGFNAADPRISQLLADLRLAGIKTFDQHAGNFGWIIKGKPVWIDFDPNYTFPNRID